MSSPTVLLLHTLPDGSSHIDWMLARDSQGVAPLVTFRLPRRIDDLTPESAGGVLAAERIGDHRPAYLAYEGPIPGGQRGGQRGGEPIGARGHVRRVARGLIEHWDRSDADGIWDIVVVWDAPRPTGEGRCRQRLRLARTRKDRWTVTVANATRLE